VDWYQPTTIDGPALLDVERAADTALARGLREFAPDVLIVEMFWAPIHHIRRLFDCEVWLLLRKCIPEWFVGPPEARYDPARWDRIIAMEPIEHPSITHTIDPIVCANPGECHPPDALRRRLGVPAGKTLAVVAHTGPQTEQDALAAVGAEDVHVVHRCVFTPFRRPIDDQAWRARACADVWPASNGADTLANWILANDAHV
jgi:hypothetical protein